MFKDKTIMVTGGTGSFGNAVVRRFLDTDIGEIRIFSRDEKKQDDMRRVYQNPKLKFHIGDVRGYDSIRAAMEGVDYVFQAAALKQVPSCEFFPGEAVRTNILGTENVLNAAVDAGVKSVICLSTDKAVYPINAMGMSKALMEKTALARSRNSGNTTICVTRYGNVMCSRGSVIPLFINQIKDNQPITITDPNMTRFMMSLEDAVELVLFAYENSTNGEIFVQKAPASTILELAEVLCEIFGSKQPVKEIGTRHGEKLFESLLTREEMAMSNDLGDYYKIPIDSRDLNYGNFFSSGKDAISTAEDYTSHNTKRLAKQELKDLLLSLDYVQNQLVGDSSSEGY
ncbi:MAG: polysaccharide biosynthesis protein [Oscillospiraceae bacterium]|nr:polysaccharide biosynthesis protein [Oscillospiraceae bacterium]